MLSVSVAVAAVAAVGPVAAVAAAVIVLGILRSPQALHTHMQLGLAALALPQHLPLEVPAAALLLRLALQPSPLVEVVAALVALKPTTLKVAVVLVGVRQMAISMQMAAAAVLVRKVSTLTERDTVLVVMGAAHSLVVALQALVPVLERLDKTTAVAALGAARLPGVPLVALALKALLEFGSSHDESSRN